MPSLEFMARGLEELEVKTYFRDESLGGGQK